MLNVWVDVPYKFHNLWGGGSLLKAIGVKKCNLTPPPPARIIKHGRVFETVIGFVLLGIDATLGDGCGI